MIIYREKDINRIKKLGLPLIVYGRRKTGKTFLVKQVFKNSLYFFVRRDKTIYYEQRRENITYEELVRIIDEVDKIIIIDEFHRLPEQFLDYLHMKAPKNLVLVTSTLNLAKRLIQKKSPIVGLFLEFKLDLISTRDIINNLSRKLAGKKLVESAVYLREPLLLRFFNKDLWQVLKALKFTIPALIGEIFSEEEKELSNRYEAIIRALSLGKNSLSEIVSYLYSYKLIDKQDTGAIKQYVKNLIDMGLITRVKDYFKNRYYYFIASPVIELYYYLDEKYNFSEIDVDRKYFKEKLGRHVESFFRELLVELFNKTPVIINKPNLEVDIALTDFKKLSLVAEVKWKNRINSKELRKLEEKLNMFKCQKVLIVPDKSLIRRDLKNIQVWDVSDVIKFCRYNHGYYNSDYSKKILNSEQSKM
ncbi:ATP-binding protein [Candidatus Woesearchaeota archaeon]|nr:ATP-binding protein [Candidatus Woesearchaeota archaeon]